MFKKKKRVLTFFFKQNMNLSKFARQSTSFSAIIESSSSTSRASCFRWEKMIKIISRWTEKHISYISNSVILYNENEWCMFWSFHENDYDVNSNKEKVTSSARLGGSQWWCVAEISQRRRSIATHKKGKHLSKIWWILIKTTSAPLNVFIRKWSRT